MSSLKKMSRRRNADIWVVSCEAQNPLRNMVISCDIYGVLDHWKYTSLKPT